MRKQMTLAQTRAFVAAAHGAQLYGDHPYSYHTEGVERVAVRYGFGRSTCIRKICLGHDLLEDTRLTAHQLLEAGFTSIQVRAIEAVTDGSGASRKERKARVYAMLEDERRGLIAKLCDRIFNVEENIKTGNWSKFRMYRKEHVELERRLRNREDLALEPMWLRLEALFATRRLDASAS